MRRRIALAAAAVVLCGAVSGCGSDDGDDDAAAGDGPGRTVLLTAADISFTPTEIELEAGQPVEIEVRNTGQLQHNLTVEDLDVDEDVEGGATIRVAATPEAGTYTFVCKYHPGSMTGTITVG